MYDGGPLSLAEPAGDQMQERWNGGFPKLGYPFGGPYNTDHRKMQFKLRPLISSNCRIELQSWGGNPLFLVYADYGSLTCSKFLNTVHVRDPLYFWGMAFLIFM